MNITNKYKTFNNFNINYHIFGTIENNDSNNINENIKIHNFYNDNTIIEKLHENNIHGILHLSIFEESYCYALTNSINSGVPIFYINHGAINERLILKNKYFPSLIEDIEENYELFLNYLINNNGVYDFYKLNNTIQPNRWYLENYNLPNSYV